MSIFSIGVSGLNTAQAVLTTTSNNITNVYTPGYTRQVVKLGEGLAGGGVQVVSVERQFNRFATEQLNRSNGVLASLETYKTQVGQIDNLLADSDAGLAPLMNAFFASLQNVASVPSDPAARQGMLGAAQTMTAQLRSFATYFNDLQGSVNNQVGDEVGQINNAAAQLAKLNREIGLTVAKTGEAPNALLDQRDQLVSDLSKRLDIRLSIQDGGSYNITLRNGMSLVSGSDSFELASMRSSEDPTRMVVGYKDGAGNQLEVDESIISGGSLGGLLAFRSEVLDRTQNQLGRLAASLALAFNEQHAAGFDITGKAGGDFFTVGQPRAYSNANNQSGTSLTVAVSNVSELTGSDYDVSWTAAEGYRVVSRDSGAEVAANFDSTANTLSFGGLNIQINGSPAEGDRFLVQPTRGAAEMISLAIDDPALIAAGSGGGTGDNRNLLQLQALQNKKVVGGQATFSQSYAGLVSDIGNSANIAAVNLSAQQGLNQQLSALQQADAGVNLDEEAANLLRFQQFYQASAKIIDVGSTVFDTLLGIRS